MIKTDTIKDNKEKHIVQTCKYGRVISGNNGSNT